MKKNLAPPRFMVVLKDFKTDVQIQVGAPKMSDFLKPLPSEERKHKERFELERVIRYFERKVKEAEKQPWKKPDKADAPEAELV